MRLNNVMVWMMSGGEVELVDEPLFVRMALSTDAIGMMGVGRVPHGPRILLPKVDASARRDGHIAVIDGASIN